MAEPIVDLLKHPSGIIPTITNVVSSVDLGCKIDLAFIANRANNAEYNPKGQVPAVIMRIREPKTTALIYATGKMVCFGAKSEAQSELAARKFARTVKMIGHPEAGFKNFKIHNIVASCDVKFLISLEKLAIHHMGGGVVKYEPILFPGLKYRMKNPDVSMVMFFSGKIIITGAKVREDTYRALENIYPVLSTEFRKPVPT